MKDELLSEENVAYILNSKYGLSLTGNSVKPCTLKKISDYLNVDTYNPNIDHYQVSVKNVEYILKKLESEYTIIEYIEADGQQYLDTGIYPNGNTRITMWIYLDSIPTSGQTFRGVFGSRTSGNNNSFCLWQNYNKGYNYGWDYNDTRYNLGSDVDGLKYMDFKNIGTINSTSIGSNSVESFASTATFTIFAINQESKIDPRFSSGKLYNFSMFENDTEVLRLIPCRRKTDQVCGMYDILHETFYISSGTSEFIGGPEVIDFPNKFMFSDYSLVEYVESTGSQYIDLGIFPNQDTRIVCDFQKNEVTDSDSFIFGSRGSNYTNMFAVIFKNDIQKWRIDHRNEQYRLSSIGETWRILLDMRSDAYSTIENENTVSYKNFQAKQSLYLFAVNQDDNIKYLISAKIYSVKIYSGSNIIMYLVPVSRNEDNAVGFLDIVNKKMYTSKTNVSLIPGRKILI